MNNDLIRIGDRKVYKGIFKLIKTDDIFKYAPYGRLTSFYFMKDFKPEIEIDEEGMYIGEGRFVIGNGDCFKENEKKGSESA